MSSKAEARVSVHRLGTDAFLSRKWDDTAPGDSHSNHDMPMKLGLSPCLTCERLRGEKSRGGYHPSEN